MSLYVTQITLSGVLHYLGQPIKYLKKARRRFDKRTYLCKRCLVILGAFNFIRIVVTSCLVVEHVPAGNYYRERNIFFFHTTFICSSARHALRKGFILFCIDAVFLSIPPKFFKYTAFVTFSCPC